MPVIALIQWLGLRFNVIRVIRITIRITTTIGVVRESRDIISKAG